MLNRNSFIDIMEDLKKKYDFHIDTLQLGVTYFDFIFNKIEIQERKIYAIVSLIIAGKIINKIKF